MEISLESLTAPSVQLCIYEGLLRFQRETEAGDNKMPMILLLFFPHVNCETSCTRDFRLIPSCDERTVNNQDRRGFERP